MRIWLSVYDEKEREEYKELIKELYASLRQIKELESTLIFVMTKKDMDRYFYANHLHDLPSLTDDFEKIIEHLPIHLKYHKNGWRRFMAFRSYPQMQTHSVTFSIT